MSKTKKIVISIISVILIVGIILMIMYLATDVDMNKNVDIKVVKLDNKNKSIVDKKNSYLGHPDIIRTSDGNLLCTYPAGHGKGQIITKVSKDNGKTWDSELQNTPKSWAKSQETPILYKVTLSNGKDKFLLLSGCPEWDKKDYPANGFNCSISEDGTTWSEFTNWYGIEWAKQNNSTPYDGIVAMASLIRLKDNNGNDIDKWLGIFHNHQYENYKSILTFDENEQPVWSTPTRLFDKSQWEIESFTGLCEIGSIRNPKDNTIILIARANNRRTNSMITFSNDEGETWSNPTELPTELTGDRHKIVYDNSTNKLVITFRQIVPGKQNIFDNSGFIGRQWVAWVGSFEDLMSYKDNDNSNDKKGDAIIVLGKNNILGNKKADTGYAGIIVENGNIITASYGRFDAVSTKPFIMCCIFNLKELGIVK